MALEVTEKQVLCEAAEGRTPGANGSIMKVCGSESLQKPAELTAEAVAYYAAPHQKDARTVGSNVEPIGPAHALTALPRHLNHRAASIYAGSNEIQRNIVAKLCWGWRIRAASDGPAGRQRDTEEQNRLLACAGIPSNHRIATKLPWIPA